MTETEGMVYFAIKTEDGSIQEDTIDGFLGLDPTKFTKMYSRGTKPKCTIWEISTDKVKDPNMSLLINDIIRAIRPFKDKLIKFKEAYNDVVYLLEIVIYHGDNAAGFSLENDQLLFLSEIGAVIDVDQYNYKD